jgi:hypothetical protein
MSSIAMATSSIHVCFILIILRYSSLAVTRYVSAVGTNECIFMA